MAQATIKNGYFRLDHPSQKILLQPSFLLVTTTDMLRAICLALPRVGSRTNSTKVHILDGASNYQEWILQTGTPISDHPAATELMYWGLQRRW